VAARGLPLFPLPFGAFEFAPLFRLTYPTRLSSPPPPSFFLVQAAPGPAPAAEDAESEDTVTPTGTVGRPEAVDVFAAARFTGRRAPAVVLPPALLRLTQSPGRGPGPEPSDRTEDRRRWDHRSTRRGGSACTRVHRSPESLGLL